MQCNLRKEQLVCCIVVGVLVISVTGAVLEIQPKSGVWGSINRAGVV